MRVIGIDPGYAINGWAILDKNNDMIIPVDYGVFDIPKKPLYERMQDICIGIKGLIEKHHPDEAAIEKLYFNKNVKTAIDVAQIRGAVAMILFQEGIPVYDYTPLQVKQAVVGYGRAEKNQVQNMVKILLNLEEIPKPDDAADALAIGICHLHSSGFNKMVEEKE